MRQCHLFSRLKTHFVVDLSLFLDVRWSQPLILKLESMCPALNNDCSFFYSILFDTISHFKSQRLKHILSNDRIRYSVSSVVINSCRWKILLFCIFCLFCNSREQCVTYASAKQSWTKPLRSAQKGQKSLQSCSWPRILWCLPRELVEHWSVWAKTPAPDWQASPL